MRRTITLIATTKKTSEKDQPASFSTASVLRRLAKWFFSNTRKTPTKQKISRTFSGEIFSSFIFIGIAGLEPALTWFRVRRLTSLAISQKFNRNSILLRNENCKKYALTIKTKPNLTTNKEPPPTNSNGRGRLLRNQLQFTDFTLILTDVNLIVLSLIACLKL